MPNDPTTNVLLVALRVIADGQLNRRDCARLAVEALRVVRHGLVAAIEPEDATGDLAVLASCWEPSGRVLGGDEDPDADLVMVAMMDDDDEDRLEELEADLLEDEASKPATGAEGDD